MRGEAGVFKEGLELVNSVVLLYCQCVGSTEAALKRGGWGESVLYRRICSGCVGTTVLKGGEPVEWYCSWIWGVSSI